MEALEVIAGGGLQQQAGSDTQKLWVGKVWGQRTKATLGHLGFRASLNVTGAAYDSILYKLKCSISVINA